MAIDVYKLFQREMTDEIIHKHPIKTYFSGRLKQIGDRFLLGMLILSEKDNLEIVIDIPEKDIDDGIFELTHLQVRGRDKLPFFKLKDSNEFIDDLLKEMLHLHKTEEKLEILKGKIDQEIYIRDINEEEE